MSYIEKRSQKKFNAGDVIFYERDRGSSMFIIQSGKVEITTVINNQKVSLAKLGKGAIFGEMSLIDNCLRSATVTAMSNVNCLEISRALFKDHLMQIPAWMRSFYQIIVERLRESNKKHQILEPWEVAKQVVFLLAIFLSKEKSDIDGKVSVPWQRSAENIAFLLNIPLNQVVMVMNKLSLSSLVTSKIDAERKRVFLTEDFSLFQKFSEYCKDKFLERQGKEILPEFEERPHEELQFLNFIGELVAEQATASDLHRSFLEDRCSEDLGRSLKEFDNELKSLVRKGILKSMVNSAGDKYYEVNRNLLDKKLASSATLELFEEVEAKLG